MAQEFDRVPVLTCDDCSCAGDRTIPRKHVLPDGVPVGVGRICGTRAKAGRRPGHGDDHDWFGVSVSISSDGNIAIIGANGDDNERGSAYIFDLT